MRICCHISAPEERHITILLFFKNFLNNITCASLAMELYYLMLLTVACDIILSEQVGKKNIVFVLTDDQDTELGGLVRVGFTTAV